jgi:hypothetical protein
MKFFIDATAITRFNKLISRIDDKKKSFSLHFLANQEKTTLFLESYDWAIAMPVSCRRPPKSFMVPYNAVNNVPANTTGKIAFTWDETTGYGTISGNFESKFPKTHQFQFETGDHSLPPVPKRFKQQNTKFLNALKLCTRFSGRQGQHYILSNIRIFKNGTIAAMDGRQAVFQAVPNYLPPGQRDLLVRACSLYGYHELRKETVELGVKSGWTVFRFGDLLFWTKPDIERFPKLENTRPRTRKFRVSMRFSSEDIAFLIKNLNSIDPDATVEIYRYDTQNTVTVQVGEMAMAITPRLFKRDEFIAKTSCKRFLTALKLGCTEFRFGNVPGYATGVNREYVWLPLDYTFSPLESEKPLPPTTTISP